jgi:hypothetical protein
VSFAPQAAPSIFAFVCLANGLNCYCSFQALIPAVVDYAHPTFTDFAPDTKVADHFVHVHHRNSSVGDPQRDYRSMTAGTSACLVLMKRAHLGRDAGYVLPGLPRNSRRGRGTWTINAVSLTTPVLSRVFSLLYYQIRPHFSVGA